jgi:hypothetical protein
MFDIAIVALVGCVQPSEQFFTSTNFSLQIPYCTDPESTGIVSFLRTTHDWYWPNVLLNTTCVYTVMQHVPGDATAGYPEFSGWSSPPSFSRRRRF